MLRMRTKKEGYAPIEQNQASFQACTTLSSTNKATYTMWHKIMGHPQDLTLKFLNNSHLLNITSWKQLI